MITFSCPTCGKTHRSRDESVGKKARCQNCGQKIQVPVSQNDPRNNTVLGTLSNEPLQELTEEELVVLEAEDEPVLTAKAPPNKNRRQRQAIDVPFNLYHDIRNLKNSRMWLIIVTSAIIFAISWVSIRNLVIRRDIHHAAIGISTILLSLAAGIVISSIYQPIIDKKRRAMNDLLDQGICPECHSDLSWFHSRKDGKPDKGYNDNPQACDHCGFIEPF